MLALPFGRKISPEVIDPDFVQTPRIGYDIVIF
jgi:hypothetical protein